MRVAVLAHNLIRGGGLSVGRNICALLPKLGPQHQYLIFVPEGMGYDRDAERASVRVKTVRRMNPVSRMLFELRVLPREVSRFGADVALGLGNIGLLRPHCKQAILIHQPQIIYDSRHYGKALLRERLQFLAIKRWVSRSLKRTQMVFCQTPIIQERFATVFCYPLDQIEIAPNAVSEFAKVESSSIAIPEVLKDKGKFDLFLLASYSTHKNIEMLVTLFRQFPDQLKDVRCIITISAGQHKHAASLLREIERRGLGDKVVNVGPLEQEELAGYFCHCDALFFPTLLESFSGTYLEAMHFGLPILTSDLDFARYICGDAAIYFDPWNPAEIVDKILLVKSRGQLRADLVRKGSERMSTFFKSWEEIVSNMLREIERI
ncbi:MAG: glycosyltransferase [Phycisphaerae bacterium]|nr:glycosyltransferase [Phycisphaerae bacterium]